MMGPFSRWWDRGHVDVFTVHEPPDAPADRIDRAEKLVFLKDGFTWSAFLFGPFWLIAKGEWIGLAFYVAAMAVLSALVNAGGDNAAWTMLASLALNIFLGFEASSLRRWSLDRKGFVEIGTVSGRNGAECERRFFETWLPGQPAISARELSGAAGTLAASATILPRQQAAPRRRGWRELIGMKA